MACHAVITWNDYIAIKVCFRGDVVARSLRRDSVKFSMLPKFLVARHHLMNLNSHQRKHSLHAQELPVKSARLRSVSVTVGFR